MKSHRARTPSGLTKAIADEGREPMNMEMLKPAIQNEPDHNKRNTEIHGNQAILLGDLAFALQMPAIDAIRDETCYDAATAVAHTTGEVEQTDRGRIQAVKAAICLGQNRDKAVKPSECGTYR